MKLDPRLKELDKKLMSMKAETEEKDRLVEEEKFNQKMGRLMKEVMGDEHFFDLSESS